MFNEAYLKVETPDTTNGRDPVILGNGKMKYTESHLHVLAKDMMERKNAKRPAHLKHIITVVEAPPPTPAEPKEFNPSDISAAIEKMTPEQKQAIIDSLSPKKKANDKN